MMAFRLFAAILAVSPNANLAAHSAVNPIRKVVSMLQAMEKQVAVEGEKDKELYEKYMCYCKTSGNDLANSIAAAEAKISSLPSEIEAAEEEQKQAAAALKQAKADRKAAKEAKADATAVRENQAATFASLKAEL